MESPTVWRDTGGLQGFTVSRFLKQIYLYQHMVLPAWWFQVAGDGEGYLNIMANGGVGDVDVYVRFDEYPTSVQKRQVDPIRTFETLRKRIYDMRSATPGNQEQIIIERPQQGRSLPLSFNMLLLLLSSCHFNTISRPHCHPYLQVLYCPLRIWRLQGRRFRSRIKITRERESVRFLISFILLPLHNTQDIWAHPQMLLVSEKFLTVSPQDNCIAG